MHDVMREAMLGTMRKYRSSYNITALHGDIVHSPHRNVSWAVRISSEKHQVTNCDK